MATTAMPKEEYLKKYLSTSSCTGDKQKKKKKSKEIVESSSPRQAGMRLIDDDTYIQSKPGKKQTARKLADIDDDFDNEEEDEDEELDEIERAIRLLNRKSAIKNKKSRDQAEPTFKIDSFVTVEGGSTESTSSHIQIQDTTKIKTEVKQEVESEDEDNTTHRSQKQRTMDDGRRAGLVSKQVMKEEMTRRSEAELREREQHQISKGEMEKSTEEAETTRKRATGFNRNARKNRQREGETSEEATAEKEAQKEREAAKQAQLEKRYSSWNRGIAQQKEREERLEDMERTLAEGFTRYADDEAMNDHLRDQLHEEDPMASYFRLKNHNVQMRSGIVYPTYKGQFLPNRYGIAPGYRWDGVDRSNGFESKLALEKNKKTARETDTYRAIQECEQ